MTTSLFFQPLQGDPTFSFSVMMLHDALSTTLIVLGALTIRQSIVSGGSLKLRCIISTKETSWNILPIPSCKKQV